MKTEKVHTQEVMRVEEMKTIREPVTGRKAAQDMKGN